MVLDLGCGAGQTLIARYPNQTTFGLDIDYPVLQFGKTLSQDVQFLCGRAEAIPFGTDVFDLVIARVSLAYTDIAQVLGEARRVLKPGGRLWITLHSWRVPWEMARAGNWKAKLFLSYIVLNSVLFHLTQRQFGVFGRRESFQTRSGMLKALRQAGFEDIVVTQGNHFLIEARSSKAQVRVSALAATQRA